MKKENDVYFLGSERKTPHRKKTIYILASAVILLFILLAGKWLLSQDKKTTEDKMLQTISVYPEDQITRQPRFDKDKDITAFYQWFGQNLKYPEGLENIKAKVIVRFVVNTDSTLCDFKVLEAPKERAFENAVITLLKGSPKWSPAELADGTKVRIEFTLPVSFQPEK